MMLESSQTRHSIDTEWMCWQELSSDEISYTVDNHVHLILPGCFQHRPRVMDAVENRISTGGRVRKQKQWVEDCAEAQLLRRQVQLVLICSAVT